MKSIIIALIIAASAALDAQILITEVHPAPAAGEPEWIELENIGSRSKRIDGWFLCDDRSCKEIEDLTIPAKRRAILVKDEEALRAIRDIPADVIVYEMTLPSLNNTSDAVRLLEKDSVQVDAIFYDMSDYESGRSIEREGELVGGKVSFTDEWQTCSAADGATCGRLNNAVRVERDLRLQAIRVVDAAVRLEVFNAGRSNVSGARIEIDLPGKHIMESLPTLLPEDVWELTISLDDIGWPLRLGWVDICAQVNVEEDRPENNDLCVLLQLPPPGGTVTINELMFEPWPGMPDYIEIVNLSADTIDISGWQVTDERGDAAVVPDNTAILPEQFLVLTMHADVRHDMDSGVPIVIRPSVNLNSDADDVSLRTASGFVVDEVFYDSDWHEEVLAATKGIALEKLDPTLVSNAPTSWTSSGSMRGGTPGSPNSVDVSVAPSTDLQASPSPFSSERTSTLNPSVLSFTQPFRHAIASLSIRTINGRLVRRLLDASFIGSQGAVAWRGHDDYGTRLPIGPYVAVLECVDAASSRTHRASCVVVIGE